MCDIMAMSGILLLFLICNSFFMDFTKLRLVSFTEIDNLYSFVFIDIITLVDSLQSVPDVSEIFMSSFFTSVLGHFSSCGY